MALNDKIAAVEHGDLWRKGLATLLQVASWFTTLWAVQWLWADGAFSGQVTGALLAEFAFIVMKTQLFSGGSKVVGWAGIALDGLVNMGGILPRAGKLLTFPPIAAVLGFMGVDAGATATQKIGTFLIALIGGILLSVLPHRLWED